MPKLSKADKWEMSNNMVFSCPEHGKETYFTIKKLELQRKMRNYVYVWFKNKNKHEKMWVRITQGDQKKGVGKLDNAPQILKHLHLSQIIKYKTDKEGITHGQPSNQ